MSAEPRQRIARARALDRTLAPPTVATPLLPARAEERAARRELPLPAMRLAEETGVTFAAAPPPARSRPRPPRPEARVPAAAAVPPTGPRASRQGGKPAPDPPHWCDTGRIG